MLEGGLSHLFLTYEDHFSFFLSNITFTDGGTVSLTSSGVIIFFSFVPSHGV